MTPEPATVLAMRQLVAEAALFRRGRSRARRSVERLAAVQERRRSLRPAEAGAEAMAEVP